MNNNGKFLGEGIDVTLYHAIRRPISDQGTLSVDRWLNGTIRGLLYDRILMSRPFIAMHLAEQAQDDTSEVVGNIFMIRGRA